MKDFNNKTVWITGASSGIGEEMACQMAKEGAKIILTARNEDKLNQVKSRLAGEGHQVFPMDLLNSDEIQAQAKEILDQVGLI
ncbi:MAG: SDR family NAD(P)-dependent oxidoreductase, partial [Bacteroidota bacterium]